MKELIELFFTFAKIGSFTFGGGLAMLPIIQREIVENKKWATDDEIVDYFAIGQCTPGIIAVNTSTFIGYKRKGVLGAIFATAGMIFPSLIIITVLALFINNFAELEIVKHAFAGIRAVVAALVIVAVIKMWKSSIKDYIGIIIFAVTFILSVIFNMSSVLIIILAIVAGIIISSAKKEK